ncbi:MAG TPA: hypothetical protein VK742_18395 [Candidatus Sulfotelmatobacter sp.]|jgi:hypothetical protein|nr:hypothetical protein [Candidatus Sulfotelmatobacter sp.]
MFNLEQAITEWRQQMLAAGIQSPASLNELEIHLREEIERQMKSGSNARTAFEISLQQIGRPEVLSHEFKKSEGTTVKTMGYLALCIGTLIMLRLLTIHLVASPLAPEKCGDWRSVLGFLSGQIDAAHWRPNEQYAWLIAAAAIIFFGLCSAIFYFEASDTRSIRLWKTIGLLYSTLAIWLSAFPIWLILTVPRYDAAVGVTGRILVFAALTVSVLSIFGWRKYRRILPVITNQRIRRLAGTGGCIFGGMVVASVLIFLQPVHFSIGIILLTWSLAGASVLGSLGYGLEKAVEG